MYAFCHSDRSGGCNAADAVGEARLSISSYSAGAGVIRDVRASLGMRKFCSGRRAAYLCHRDPCLVAAGTSANRRGLAVARLPLHR